MKGCDKENEAVLEYNTNKENASEVRKEKGVKQRSSLAERRFQVKLH